MTRTFRFDLTLAVDGADYRLTGEADLEQGGHGWLAYDYTLDSIAGPGDRPLPVQLKPDIDIYEAIDEAVRVADIAARDAQADVAFERRRTGD